MAKVLVVDDELGYRVSLEFFLAQAGHEVAVVATTAAAIARAQDFQPEILVVDWLLGDKQTGADLIRELRVQLPDIRVIVMSGLGPQMVRHQTEDLRIFRMVEKPFEPGAILDAVREAGAGLDSAHGSVGS
ncbi:MAG TPA: response regulator [Pirellulales bacterium]|jgi:DNA-binding response OmpR family regulator